MLEVGEGAGGLELVVHEHLVVGGFDLVEDRRQFLVFGDNELRRLFGDMRIVGDDGGDRLADIVHLVQREDRLVVEGRPVIGIGDDLADILAGIDAVDAGKRARLAHVDRLDAAVRQRAAEDLAAQHAGQPHQMRVFGAAAHFRLGFQPRQRAPDLLAGVRGVHGLSLACAARTARPT